MDRLIVALDVPGFQEAIDWVDKLKDHVKIFKVGSQIFVSSGPRIVEEIHKRGGEVFLDLKFHDIPNTTAQAVCEAAKMNVFMVNVHASGGLEMMKAVDKYVNELSGLARRPKIIGVTVLTSWARDAFKQMGYNRDIQQQVKFLASLVKQAGLDGVVASPQEAGMIREELGPEFIIVTPGVRLSLDNVHDQKRIMTPKQAVAQGSDYIVMGRSILQAKDPISTVKQVLEQVND